MINFKDEKCSYIDTYDQTINCNMHVTVIDDINHVVEKTIFSDMLEILGHKF